MTCADVADKWHHYWGWAVGGVFVFQKQAFEHHSLNANKNSSHAERPLVTNGHNSQIRLPVTNSPASPYGGVEEKRREESFIPATTQDPTPPELGGTSPYLIVLEWPVNERPWGPWRLVLAGSLLRWCCVHICRDCIQEVLLGPVNHLRGTVGENCKEMLSWLLGSFPSFFSTGGKNLFRLLKYAN